MSTQKITPWGGFAGQTMPEGIKTIGELKALQESLGVAADGHWGLESQKAYEKSLGGGEASTTTQPTTKTSIIGENIPKPQPKIVSPSAENPDSMWDKTVRFFDTDFDKKYSPEQQTMMEKSLVGIESKHYNPEQKEFLVMQKKDEKEKKKREQRAENLSKVASDITNRSQAKSGAPSIGGRGYSGSGQLGSGQSFQSIMFGKRG